METVTVKRQEYKLDTVYEDENGLVGFLRAVDTDGLFELNMNNKVWHCEAIERARFELGTITDAPIELEKGDTWMCRYEIQTGNESCEHFELPFCVGVHGGFYGVPANALLFMPKYKMVRERT